MKTILALYRVPSIAEAKIIAVSVDPELVAHVAGRLLASREPPADPVIEKLDRGRRGALKTIHQEALRDDDRGRTLRLIRDEALSEEEGQR